MNSARRSVCALALVAISFACSKSDNQPQAAQGYGGTISISASADADILFPPLILSVQGKQISDQIFDNLADIGLSLNTVGDKDFVPRLAKSWIWGPDSTWIEFSLVDSARWHDGVPVRSSDVRFTFNLVKDPKLASPLASSLDEVDSVTTTDSVRARVWIHRRTPSSFFKIVSPVPILPEHLLKGTAPGSFAGLPYSRSPVGSGRFKFAEWKPGASIALVADSANYRGRPHADKIVWLVAQNYDAAAVRFLTGEADFLDVVKPEYLARASSNGHSVVTSAGLDYGYVAFNEKTPDGRKPHPLFADRELRRALARALDRKAMVINVYDTLAVVAAGPFTRAQPTADTTLGFPFDTAAANRTLDSLGWSRDARGMRSRNGIPLRFSLMVPSSSSTRTRYAILLQNQWKQVGADVRLETLELNTFGARLEKKNFDALLNAWHIDPDPAAVREEWTSSQTGPGGFNIVSYGNAAFDATVDSAAREFDPARSVPLYRRAYRILVDDAPAVWLYEPRGVFGVGPRIQVFGIRPDAWWANIADWSVTAAR